jgi:hypothetical protein
MTQTRAGWLSQAGWAEWANRPVGPAGQLGQAGFGQLIQKQNFKFKFKGYFLLEFKPKFKNSNNSNKTLSYSLMK